MSLTSPKQVVAIGRKCKSLCAGGDISQQGAGWRLSPQGTPTKPKGALCGAGLEAEPSIQTSFQANIKDLFKFYFHWFPSAKKTPLQEADLL